MVGKKIWLMRQKDFTGILNSKVPGPGKLPKKEKEPATEEKNKICWIEKKQTLGKDDTMT